MFSCGTVMPALARARSRSLVATAIVCSLLVPGTAFAEVVQCGQRVTHDVTLEADLDCSGDGLPALTIGADGITVDLGGHTIYDDIASVGVSNVGAYDRLTIRGGRIAAGEVSIALQDASRNRLVALISGRIVVIGGERNVVRDSVVAGGRSPGLVVGGSDRVRIVDNTVRGGFTPAITIGSNHGLVARNTTFRGISAFGANNRVVRNRIEGGSVEIGGTDNVVARNQILNGRSQQYALSVTGGGTVVSGNSVSGALFDGISIDAGATDTIVRRNVSTHNLDDGIDVRSSSARLIRNTADDNGDLGIEAVPGVFAVGNHAQANGNPLQCLNVACG